MKLRTLLSAVLAASAAAVAAEPSMPYSMSDEIYRTTAYDLQHRKEGPDVGFRASIYPLNRERLSAFGGLAPANEFRRGNVMIHLSGRWSLGANRDEFGRTAGFTYDFGAGRGSAHFGAFRSAVTGAHGFGVTGTIPITSW